MTDRERLLDIIRVKIPSGVVCVGIDGRCGAGKSTLAQWLCSELDGAAVIHMDDFYLPPALRTPERMAEGNAHFERFLAEVAPHLRSGKAFSYRRFDCAAMDYAPVQTDVPPGGVRVVEGAYSLHPLLRSLYDMAVFCDIGRDAQRARILERSGPDAWERFHSLWIPLEEAYFRRYTPEDGAWVLSERLS